jgi:hypothetical protein
MKSLFTFGILVAIKFLTKLFYRVEMSWLGDPPPDRWKHIRLVAFLHHTSLFEPVFLGGVPNSFVKRVAQHGVIPAAEKTICRPLVGRLFRFIAAHVISISRERDHTWFNVLEKIDPDSMVIILPEGRMMRKNGLDSNGQPMTVRGGIADILEAMKEGRMLIAYSGGLHHIQAPGEHVPRIFTKARMNLEVIDMADYIEQVKRRYPGEEFKKAVRADLEHRRERNCPVDGRPPWPEPALTGEETSTRASA